MGRDTIVPPLPGRPPPIGHAAPRTRQQRPHKSVSTKKPTPPEGGEREGAAGHRSVPPPPPNRQHQESANTPSEHTPNANTKPPASKHDHNKPQQGTPPSEHKERPRQSAWASKMCERGNPRAPAGATGMKQSRRNPHKGGHAGQAHKASAQTTLFAPTVPPCARPTGG